MGTRGLTIVIANGKHKIAQYGQWDHYPSGQGLTALGFCREYLTKPKDIERLRQNLKEVRWLTDELIADAYQRAGVSQGDEFISKEDGDKVNAELPFLTRDHGANILGFVFAYPDMKPQCVPKEPYGDEWVLVEGKAELVLRDSYEFIKESLHCEWAYVLDLDRKQLEVYMGFNENPVPPGQRFSEMGQEKPAHREAKYFPCVEVGIWKFNALPTNDEFVNSLEENDDED